MTTNSPNPVDGDVQALIADCQAEIEDLKRSIDRCDAIGTADYLYHLQSKLKRQYAALAALTAEPVAFITEQNLKSLRKGLHECFVKRQPVMVRPISLYTTPPAQLLRPVELPDISAGKYYTEEGTFMAFDYKRDLVAAIRASGGEVSQ